MTSGALIVGETRSGVVRDVTWELIGAARALCDGKVALLLVTADAEGLVPGVALDGPDFVLVAHSPCEHFEPHVTQAAVEAAIDHVDPRFVLFGHTVDGFGVAPAVAAANGLGLITDVTRVDRADGVAEREIYGGRVVAEISMETDDRTVLMIRPGAFDAVGSAGTVPAVTHLAVDLSCAAQTEHLGFDGPDEDGLDLTDADVVVGIGRGIEDGSEVERFGALAAHLGGVLGVSRPIVDVGWASSSRQIGRSGQAIAPKVYLALGIAGSPQHLAGIRDAETVIAVNTDPSAPIFGAAHFGVVADLFDVADALGDLFS